MTVDKKVSLADWIKIGAVLIGIGMFYADAKNTHAELADLKVQVSGMKDTIQTQAITIQKLSDALDHIQNPNLEGPVRPVRYYYVAPPTSGHSSTARQPSRDDVLNGE